MKSRRPKQLNRPSKNKQEILTNGGQTIDVLWYTKIRKGILIESMGGGSIGDTLSQRGQNVRRPAHLFYFCSICFLVYALRPGGEGGSYWSGSYLLFLTTALHAHITMARQNHPGHHPIFALSFHTICFCISFTALNELLQCR